MDENEYLFTLQLEPSKKNRCCGSGDGERGELFTYKGLTIFLGIVGVKFLINGLIRALQILFVEFLDKFEESHAVTSVLLAVQISLCVLFSTVSGIIISIFGHRFNIALGTLLVSSGIMIASFLNNIVQVMAVFGLLVGIGSGCFMTSGESGPLSEFNKHKTLATSVSMASHGISSTIAGLATAYLVETYALQGTLWIISAVMLHGFVFAFCFPPKPKATKEIELGRSYYTLVGKYISAIKEVCVTRLIFWVLFLMTVAYELATENSKGFLVDRGMRWGIGYQDAVVIVSIWGIATTIIRFLMPLFKTPMCRIYSSIIIFPLWGVFQILSMYMDKVWSMSVFTAVSGGVQGIIGVIMALLLSDITPQHHIPLAYGFLFSLLGLVFLTTIPLSGKLYDITQSYDSVYSIYGGLCIAAGILAVYFMVLYKNYKEEESVSAQTEYPTCDSENK